VYDASAVIAAVHAALGKVEDGGPLVLLDACQTVGQLQLDVAALGCDALSGTSRKWLRGPRGVGFLYVRDVLLDGGADHALKEPGSIDHFGAPWSVDPDHSYTLRADARRFEFWENGLGAQLGFGAAVDYACDIGVDRIERRVRALGDTLRGYLDEIDGVTVADLDGGPVSGQCGVVTVDVEPLGGAVAVHGKARAAGIGLSCVPPASTALDSARRNIACNLLRLSPHYFNTDAELRTVCDFLATLLPRK